MSVEIDAVVLLNGEEISRDVPGVKRLFVREYPGADSPILLKDESGKLILEIPYHAIAFITYEETNG